MKILLLIALIIVSAHSYLVRRSRVPDDGNGNCLVGNTSRPYLEVWQNTEGCQANICLNDDYGYFVETYSCPNYFPGFFHKLCTVEEGVSGTPFPTCCKRKYCYFYDI